MKTSLHPKTAAYVGVTIAGERFVNRISVNAVSSRLSLYTHLRHHSTELKWGDMSPASAQLAFAIMADAVGSDVALDFYQDFKAEVVSKLGSSWVLEHGDVIEWVMNRSYSPAETLDRVGTAKGGVA